MPASNPAKSSSDKPAKLVPDSRLAKFSADTRIDALDQKWSDRFNWLEAFLLARSMEKPQEPTFQTVKVALTHTLPVGSVKDPSSSRSTNISLSLNLPTNQRCSDNCQQIDYGPTSKSDQLHICLAPTLLHCSNRLLLLIASSIDTDSDSDMLD